LIRHPGFHLLQANILGTVPYALRARLSREDGKRHKTIENAAPESKSHPNSQLQLHTVGLRMQLALLFVRLRKHASDGASVEKRAVSRQAP
jgi:hypothetical protein